MLVLAVAGCLSLPGLVMVLSRASRYAGSLWLAFWGGLAVGVVFGVALWFV